VGHVLQYSDALDVIDTRSMQVVNTLRIGQSPMALVYVARTSAATTANLGRQGLDMRNEVLPVDVQGVAGAGTAQARALPPAYVHFFDNHYDKVLLRPSSA